MADDRQVLWAAATDSALHRFASRHGFSSYGDVLRWSLDQPNDFWLAATTDTGVVWDAAPSVALADPAMPGAHWFPGSRLNYAENVLAPWRDRLDQTAVIAHSQTRASSILTGGDLLDGVARCAVGLRSLGVASGDRVVAYAPNIPETLIAFLATASIGAIWSSCAPEFGTRSVIDRFSQIEPSVLIAIDGYGYGRKTFDRRREVSEIVAALPTLKHVVDIPYLDESSRSSPTALEWDVLLADRSVPLVTEPVSFNHPLYILFSSGTTGLPKAIVHGHGGITVEHRKVMILHHDLGTSDRLMWFTTTGWMMWNYLVSALTAGTSIVLFDGDPAHPNLDTLWDLTHETDCTALGVSAGFIMNSRAAGLQPRAGRLRWIGSTGSPLPTEGYRWIKETMDVPVASISGGTDVCSAFVGSSPMTQVWAGEISCRLLGCAVEAFTPDGHSCPTGDVGELVVTQPMPSMPIGFWGDHDGSAYRRAYFERFPGIWHHGDWIRFTEDGTCVISGRSDATLNRGGVRLGTSDFYAVVEDIDDILDSLVVHLDHPDAGGAIHDELHLYVVLRPGPILDEQRRREIRLRLRTELSPRHVPDLIEAIPAVPRTLSGKKLEIPVKRLLLGARVSDVVSEGAVADARVLDHFVGRARQTD
ncbi:MAG: acetoacetate--CoA ligase [Ilumatobacteraceae bacterium]